MTTLAQLKGKTIHIVGASGIEGTALLLYLAGELGIEGIVAHDFAADQASFARSFHKNNIAWSASERERILPVLRALPVRYCMGTNYLQGIDTAELIFASQNWFNYPANRPALDQAIAAGAQLLGILDLGLALFAGRRITVSGSNGKSTTASLIAHLLEACSGPTGQVLLSGNERTRQVPLQELAACSSQDVAIWEVSNRHLRDRSVRGDIAVLTNITPNHIEDHGSWEAYAAAKKRLVLAPGSGGHAVLCAIDPHSVAIQNEVRASGAQLWLFGKAPPSGSCDGHCWIEANRLRLQLPGGLRLELGDPSLLALTGAHNQLNLQAALCALAASAWVETTQLNAQQLEPLYRSAPTLEGRLELVGEAQGVRWIYDIQATTAPAATVGIRAMAREAQRIVLLVGGEDKGMDYTSMAEQARRHCALIISLPGSGTEAFLNALGSGPEVARCKDLEEALPLARDRSQAGDVVLLSPGSAFFYRAFIDGGPSYRERVRAILPTDPRQETT